VAENTAKVGPPHFEDPRATSPTTGAVDASGDVLPPIPAEEVTPPPSVRVPIAELMPAKVKGGPAVRSTLVLGTGGEIGNVRLVLQLRAGHHWRSVKKLHAHKVEGGNTVLPLAFGALKAGKYRLQITASGPTVKGAVETASLAVGP
jgi:hypothetical protein